MAIENLPISVIINLLAMIYPFINVLKEKHYVQRSTAVINGVSLIITGITILIYNYSLYLFKIPLVAFPLIIGVVVIIMTSQRMKYWDTIGRSLTTLIILGVILLTQFGIINF